MRINKPAFKKTVIYYKLPYSELKLSGCKVILKSSRYAWAKVNEELINFGNALRSCSTLGVKHETN